MHRSEDDTDPNHETPYELLLHEVRTFGKITERVSDLALEIKGDMDRFSAHLDALERRAAFALGFGVAGLVVSLFSLAMVTRR